MPRSNQIVRENEWDEIGVRWGGDWRTKQQIADVERFLKSIDKNLPKVAARAINHTLGPTETLMRGIIRKKYDIKLPKNGSWGTWLKHRASVRDPRGNVAVEGMAIPAIYLKPKPPTNKRWLRGTKKRANPPKVGVSILVPKVGRVTLRGTFVVERAKAWPRADSRTGPKFHVAERVGQGRFPIRIVHGPYVADLIEPEMYDVLIQTEQRLQDRFYHEVGRVLDPGK